MYLAAGTIVGYDEQAYEFQGRSGITRKLSVSTGEAVEVISIPDDEAEDLGRDLDKLREFGRPVIVRVKIGAFGKDNGGATLSVKLAGIRFVRIADLVMYGYEAPVYVEEPAEPVKSKNGATTPAGV